MRRWRGVKAAAQPNRTPVSEAQKRSTVIRPKLACEVTPMQTPQYVESFARAPRERRPADCAEPPEAGNAEHPPVRVVRV